MPLHLPAPIIYAISSGETSLQTTPTDRQFLYVLKSVEAAVAAHVSLFQLREKAMRASVLYELTGRASEITRGSETRLLVNDRSDVARAAGANGVHLTTQSLPANVVRSIYGPAFLIGVSTHSREEALAAQVGGADFAVFGPVFDTESKREFGEPQGLEKLQKITRELRGFPVVAIGGVTLDNVEACFEAGAAGVAAIRLLSGPERMSSTVDLIKQRFKYAE